MSLSVTVLAPGLAESFAGYDAGAFTKAPALSRFLSRSQRRPFAARSLEEAAFSLFNRRVAEHALPVAPYSWLADSSEALPGYCLRADPVHLQVDTRGLILFDAATFPFSKEESQALSNSVADFLSQDGWHLSASHRQRWYLSGGDRQQLLTRPLSRVRGKSVGDVLPRGEDAPAWLNRCNELQMLMNSHPVNQQRAARALPLVNSVWIWGGGVFTDKTERSYSRVFADDALVRGLGQHDGALCEAEPQQVQRLIQRLGKNERALLVLDACSAPAAYQDFHQWNRAVERYERDCFAPLMRALAMRRLQMLELFPLNGYRYRMSFRQAWLFWRRSRGYQEIMTGENTR